MKLIEPPREMAKLDRANRLIGEKISTGLALSRLEVVSQSRSIFARPVEFEVIFAVRDELFGQFGDCVLIKFSTARNSAST